jgi:hypothetical protein
MSSSRAAVLLLLIPGTIFAQKRRRFTLRGGLGEAGES